MFNLAPVEIILVLVIALLVFGPKRLPEMGRTLGRGVRELKEAINGDADADEPRPAREPVARDAEVAEQADDVLDGVIVPGSEPPARPR